MLQMETSPQVLKPIKRPWWEGEVQNFHLRKPAVAVVEDNETGNKAIIIGTVHVFPWHGDFVYETIMKGEERPEAVLIELDEARAGLAEPGPEPERQQQQRQPQPPLRQPSRAPFGLLWLISLL